MKPAHFSHVVLQSHHPKETLEWYCDALDGHMVYENPAACFMTYDDEHHRVGASLIPGEPQVEDGKRFNGPGLNHLAFNFATITDMLKHYAGLKAKGHKPTLTINHGPTVSFYYHDPDGNNVEFFVDRFTTKQEATDFMSTPGFQANPAGILVDPEEMLAGLEAGESEESLMRFDTEAAIDVAATMAYVVRSME